MSYLLSYKVRPEYCRWDVMTYEEYLDVEMALREASKLLAQGIAVHIEPIPTVVK